MSQVLTGSDNDAVNAFFVKGTIDAADAECI
jgi:hypothetical protein